jgi:hypothetical protein
MHAQARTRVHAVHMPRKDQSPVCHVQKLGRRTYQIITYHELKGISLQLEHVDYTTFKLQATQQQARGLL